MSVYHPFTTKMDCLEFPLPPGLQCHVYPSPRSKSSPPGATSKLFFQLSSSPYPLSEVANLLLESTAFGLIPSTSDLQDSDIQNEWDPKGVQSNVTPKDHSVFGEIVLHPPIPLVSPLPQLRSPLFEPMKSPDLSTLPTPFFFQSPSPLFRAHATPDTPKYKRYWTKDRLFLNPRSPPPSPGFRARRSRKRPKRSPPAPSPSPPCLHPQQPPAVRPLLPFFWPPFPPPSPFALEAGQSREQKQRAKLDQAEHKWLVKMHRSLAWLVRTRLAALQVEEVGPGHPDAWVDRVEEGEDIVQGLRAMKLESGGLMIAFDGFPAGGDAGVTLRRHWTDELDQCLVARLGGKLRMKDYNAITPPLPVLPCNSEPTCKIPFPLLAPPIELGPPSSVVPRRARVSALVSPPLPVQRRSVRLPSSVRPPSCEFPPLKMCPATPPKGILVPAQLVAQAILRRSQLHAKPMRRGGGPPPPRSRSRLWIAD